MTTDTPVPRATRAAWVCYAAGVIAYVVAVFNRTSFGVAAVPAAERFQASASDIAAFTVVQLVVYAGLQIPVGVMIDRFGPRRLVIAGTALMAAGQALLAVAPSIAPALAARVLIGAGDAFVFTCVLRQLTAIFPARMVPTLTQVTGLLGQLGQLLSAIPFAALLAVTSWTTSFLVLAAHGILALVVTIAFFRAPGEGLKGKEIAPRDIGRQIAGAWRHPGTRLGFWTHFTGPFSVTVFTLLWGFPFMTEGLGYDVRTASTLLSLNVVVAILSAPLMGRFVVRHPLRRSTLVLTIIALVVGSWTLVIAWPGRPPLWTMVVLVVLMSLGGPGSMIGFDFARTFNPSGRLGSATGIVNVGGFVAALVTMGAMGVILDVLADGAGGGHDLSAYKAAFAFQYVVWLLGVVMIVRNRNRTRRILAREDGVVVPPLRSAIQRDWRRYQDQRRDDTSTAENSTEHPDWQI